jgi:hypothetical protein
MPSYVPLAIEHRSDVAWDPAMPAIDAVGSKGD